MQPIFRRFLVIPLLLIASVMSAQAADSAKADLDALLPKIRERAMSGETSEAAWAGELAELQRLLTKHKGDKSDDAGRIALLQAQIFAQVFEQEDKAIALLEQIRANFTGAPTAARAEAIIEMVTKQRASNQIQRALAVGSKFPEFSEPDLAGKPLSLASYRGKVVLIDFWATWCGPCINELPHVVSAYQKYHDRGFEIIGISLDRASARDQFLQFLKTNQMSWPQIFDGQQWQSKLAVKYGVNSIPATYLLDAEGTIVAKNLRGDALEKEIARLLGRK